jgi:hypothetical protein
MVFILIRFRDLSKNIFCSFQGERGEAGHLHLLDTPPDSDYKNQCRRLDYRRKRLFFNGEDTWHHRFHSSERDPEQPT